MPEGPKCLSESIYVDTQVPILISSSDENRALAPVLIVHLYLLFHRLLDTVWACAKCV